MRVIHSDSDRLILRGIPGRRIWMIAMLGFGMAMMAACVGFGYLLVVEAKSYLPLLPLSIGFLLGVLFAVTGGVTLAIGRLQLTLDRSEGRGIYEVRSPIIDAGKPCRFDLDQIDGLAIETRSEPRPGGEGFDSRVAELRMRLLKPRRVIVLDSTQNGQMDRLRALAEEVSDWLGREPRLPMVRES